MNRQKNKQAIYRFYKLQGLTILIVSLLVFAFWGKKAALSICLGGLVALIPSMIFAYRLFSISGARAAKQIVRNLYLGEVLKLITTIALFALVFVYVKINPLAFFIAYVAVVIAHWLSPIFIDKQDRIKSD